MSRRVPLSDTTHPPDGAKQRTSDVRLSQVRMIQKQIDNREESFAEWLQGKRPANINVAVGGGGTPVEPPRIVEIEPVNKSAGVCRDEPGRPTERSGGVGSEERNARMLLQNDDQIQTGAGVDVTIGGPEGDLAIDVPDGEGGHHNINCNCSVFLHVATVLKDLFNPCCKPSGT